ncbi:MAG: tetratricopeptide repeat protein [Candidatus Edwardsbacteria bacterium]|nr:tetratricopeptide repeat protein [Candidatus Edwardsbacteria bacterium]
MTEQERLRSAIAHLEAQRALLGDAVVDAALGPLSEKLEALAASGAAGTPEQRRQVTVVFADVSGFTALSERMDAELVRDTMNALWQRLDGVITAHGGMVDKHIGDAVMALWGALTVREDDAERAVRAALAMQAEVARFAGNTRVRLGMRIGVSTGPVLLGAVGTTAEFTAMGDAVNLASRLQHQAPVGGVLASHDTYRLVRGIFDVTPTAELTIKGKREPVRAYVVDKAKPLAFRMASRGVEGVETAMVGRDAELTTLQDALQRTVRERRTALVTVCGDAGVGKSRLLFEFENWIELLPDTMLLFKGRAAPAAQQVPYRLLREVFATRFGILESDPSAAVLEKFRAGCAGALAPEQADIVGHLLGFDFRASPAVAELLGSTSFGKEAGLQLAAYFRSVARQPLLLFLEDAHWADDSSLDAAERLAAELPEAPLLIVCLARPTLYERRPGWGKGGCRIDLAPLPAERSRELVSLVLQKVADVPQRLRDLIVEGAEGNPYYVEELVKMLLDEGVIVRGEPWTVVPDKLAALRVPSTLTGILQARLDSLPAGERDVLQRASVVGRRFWDSAVAVLQAEERPEPAGAVRPLLESMQRRELVFRHAPSAFAASEEYLFKHALLRDVAYETVLLRLRKRFHAQVALWLEANAGERLAEYLGLIAHHYELAGEAARAARYLRKQGNAQYRVSSYREALDLYRRALALCPPDDRRQLAAINVHIGNTLRRLSDFPASRQHHGTALQHARDAGDRQMEVNALDGIGWAVMGQGRYDEAKKHLDLALAIACVADDRVGKASVLNHLGDVAYRQGDAAATAAFGAECLELYQQLGDKQGIASALRVIGLSHFMREDYTESYHYHTQSKSVFAQIGDRWGVGSGGANQGECMRRQGRYDEAVARYREAMAIYETIGNRLGTAILLLNLGHSHAALGDDAEALRNFRAAIERSWEIGAYSVLLEVLVGAALLEARAGGHERAAQTLGMVRAHNEYNDEIRANAEPLLELLRAELGERRLAAAMERGRGMDLGRACRELIAMKQSP